MKKIIKFIFATFLLVVLVGCSKSNIEEISYDKLTKLIEDKETFILEIVQDGCVNCENFTPKFDKILKKHDIKVKSINLTNLSEEDTNSFNNLFSFNGTPTVIFITKGKEEPIYTRIVGNLSSEKITNKLKKAGYIK